MSDEKSDGEVTPPDIATLGHWPAAEEAIRKLGRDHRVPAEDIEAFLDGIKNARQKKAADGKDTGAVCK